jgi:TolB-like protein
MTQLDVMYRYGAAPSEAASMAMGRIREVYGIRRMTVDEAAKTVRIEYDATRLTEPIVHQLLRRSGLDVIERVSLIPTQPMTEPAPEPATPRA